MARRSVTRTQIEEFRDLHPGEAVFVLASGPSLATLDLEPLGRRHVIGMNRSTMIFEGARYHCAMDGRLFREFEELLRKPRYLFTFTGRPFGVGIETLDEEGEEFSWDLTRGIYSGWTVSYFTLQVAVWLGFREIYFLGLDLKHAGGRSHFFGNDRPEVDQEQRKIFPEMRRALEKAARILAPTDVEVYNASPDTDFEGFERIPYELALERTRPGRRGATRRATG